MINSLCFPFWIISPFFKTIIWSKFWIVEILWLDIIVVLLCVCFLKLLIILSSVCVSSAEKQSSKINIFGAKINALAIHSLCFCPPLKLTPLSPKIVLYFSLNFIISSWISAILQTFSISSWLAFSFPNFKLFKIESEKRNESCGTTPIFFLKLFKLKFSIGLLSIYIFPLVGLYILLNNFKNVDFPEPVVPINPRVFFVSLQWRIA